MTRYAFAIISTIAVFPTTLFGEGLVPTLERQFDVCAERPLEPAWLGELPVRENYKRLVIQTLYDLDGYQRVAEAGECSCDTLYPPWDTAVQRFNDSYLGQDRNALRQTRDDYRTEVEELRPAVKKICEAEGNW